MSETGNDKYMRQIRSFVLREGRITPSQQRALEELWPQFGLDPGQPLDLVSSFGREAPTIFEIGFGNGDSLAQMAEAQPELNFIGVEVHRPGVGHLLLQIEKRGLSNVRIYNHDAVEVLRDCIPAHSLHKLQLFFPDPWHKKRHHKRRIVQTEFANLVASRLQGDGLWHIATDWEDYAQHCLDILEPHPLFTNAAGADQFISRPASRPLTKFEQRGHRLGHGVWDLLYKVS